MRLFIELNMPGATSAAVKTTHGRKAAIRKARFL